MKIYYEIPPINAKEKKDCKFDRFSQKGPTCWYYAWKMLLLFHEKNDSKEKEIYERLKEISLVVKLMKDLKVVHLGDVFLKPSHLSFKLQLEYEKLKKIDEHGKNRIEKSRHHSIFMDIFNRFFSEKPKTRSDDIYSDRFIKGRIDKHRVKRAIDKLNSFQGSQYTNGISIISVFFGRDIFYPITLEEEESLFFKAPKPKKFGDKMELECRVLGDLLRKYGPMLVAGNFIPQKCGKLKMQAFATDIVLSYAESVTSGHAIVISGVDEVNRYIYYVDPNFSNRVSKVGAEIFFDNIWYVTFDGRTGPVNFPAKSAARYFVIKCNSTPLHEKSYCIHVENGKKRHNALYNNNQDTEDFSLV